MTLAEALAELGVERGADAERIRRAYLQLIKTRKPEADPAGFQRARQAYEIARGAGELEALASESARQVASQASPVIPLAGAPRAGAPPAEPPEDPFAEYLRAWNAVPGSADMKVRLAIARDAVAELPRDPRAYWLVASSLYGRATDDALVAALRAGWQAGWPEFLEALLLRVPQRATREEVEAGYASERLSLRLAAAAASARWNGARSAAVIAELCAAAAADADPRRHQAFPMRRVLDVILVLHEVGALAEAAAAHDALRRFLADSGLELTLVNGPLGGVWTLAEELRDLPVDFPRELRSAFAVAIRAGDPRSAFFDACFHVRHHRRDVVAWVNRLGASAPNITNVLRGALTRETGQRAARVGSIFKSWYVFPVLIAVVRMCTAIGDQQRSVSVADLPASSGPVYDTRAVQRPGTAPGLEMSRSAADELCGPSGPRYGQLVCADIEATLAAFSEGDCPEVRQRVPALKRKLHDLHLTSADDRLLTNLTLAVWQACPPQARTEGEGREGQGGDGS